MPEKVTTTIIFTDKDGNRLEVGPGEEHEAAVLIYTKPTNPKKPEEGLFRTGYIRTWGSPEYITDALAYFLDSYPELLEDLFRIMIGLLDKHKKGRLLRIHVPPNETMQ